MATITLKNSAAADVTYTLIGADMSNARYVALSTQTPTLTQELTVNQQRASLGSRGSHRATVKAAHEMLVESSAGVTAIQKQSLSLLITIPPEGSASQLADEWAALKAYVETRLNALLAGVVEG